MAASGPSKVGYLQGPSLNSKIGCQSSISTASFNVDQSPITASSWCNSTWSFVGITAGFVSLTDWAEEGQTVIQWIRISSLIASSAITPVRADAEFSKQLFAGRFSAFWSALVWFHLHPFVAWASCFSCFQDPRNLQKGSQYCSSQKLSVLF